MKIDKGICYDFFDFRLDVEKQQLLKNGQPVQLTHKAFQILLLLVQNFGQTCKKEDIFNRLWADSFVEDANLTQHIYVLRKVLGKTPDGESFIETVPRQGYRFTIEPERVFSAPANTDEFVPFEISDAPPTEPASADARFKIPAPPASFENFDSAVEQIACGDERGKGATRNAAPAPKPRPFVSPKFVLILFIVCAIAGGAAWAVYYFRQASARQASVAGFRSIAVLPFQVIGDDSDEAKIGFGMADAVITQLSRLRQIEVRPTSAVFRYAEQQTELQSVAVGRQLKVEAILEGTIQRDGERFRVSVRLLRVADGGSLWAETFYEKTSDVFAVQDAISRRVVEALSVRLTPQQERLLAERETSDQTAFQNYRLGIYFLNKRTKEDLFRAADYFRQATRSDPNYAQAWAGLADSYSMLAYYNFADVGETKQRAKTAAERALSLDDSLAEAYVALATAFIIEREDFPRAQELLERAVAVGPYNATARHRYGWILLSNGKLDEGAREIRLAQQYDPLSPAANRAFCNVLVLQRNFAEAAEQCETTLEIYPDTPNSRRDLARAYFYLGRREESFAQLEIQIKSAAPAEAATARSELAYYWAKSGRLSEAEKIFGEMKREFAKDPKRTADLALVAYSVGKRDEALAFARRMAQAPFVVPDAHLALAYDPLWDEIKSDPQFGEYFPQ